MIIYGHWLKDIQKNVHVGHFPAEGKNPVTVSMYPTVELMTDLIQSIEMT